MRNADICVGIISIRLWNLLAWNEIKQRYRRSRIGPFWLTISTGIMIGAMGPLYAKLFNQPLEKYFVYLSASIITWEMILITINDSCNGFVSNEGLIKNTALPLSVYVIKILWKNFIVFCHNLIVVIPIVIYFGNQSDLIINLILLLFGLLLWLLNGLWLCLGVAMICARFRDFTPIVNSLMGVVFFITPILWKSDMVGNKSFLISLNPFYNWIQIIRMPIIGDLVNVEPYIYSSISGLLGMVFITYLFEKLKYRVVHWV